MNNIYIYIYRYWCLIQWYVDIDTYLFGTALHASPQIKLTSLLESAQTNNEVTR